MMKHVIVRGRPVQMNTEGGRLAAAGDEAPRGSLVVSREGRAFAARIVGDDRIGVGPDPISAMMRLVESIWATARPDRSVDLAEIMKVVREEI